MDSRKEAFIPIVKTYRHENKFAIFSRSFPQSRKRKRVPTIEQKMAIDSTNQYAGRTFFLSRIEPKNAAFFEERADQLMDSADAENLCREEKIALLTRAYSNYAASILFLQLKKEEVPLDLYFSYLHAVETIAREKTSHEPNMMKLLEKFIAIHQLPAKIAQSGLSKKEKAEYVDLLQSYIEIYQRYQDKAYDSPSGELAQTPRFV